MMPPVQKMALPSMGTGQAEKCDARDPVTILG